VQAKAMGLKLVRVWGFMDCGSTDGSVPSVKNECGKDGNYFQYWDPVAKPPCYNDRENGLARLDYVISKARELGLTIMPVLTNNWPDFGGMDQYLIWYGLKKHHEFYTDPRVKQAFKGLDCPHRGSQEQPRRSALPRRSSHFRLGAGERAPLQECDELRQPGRVGQDHDHQVGRGDECVHQVPGPRTIWCPWATKGSWTGAKKHWAYQANDGVDHRALSAIKTIDFRHLPSLPRQLGHRLQLRQRLGPWTT